MPNNVDHLRQIFEVKQKELIKGDQRIREGLAKSKMKGQRLSTDQLLAAGCDTSNNPVLRSLWDAVKDYNGQWQHPTKMSTQQVSDSVGMLDFIYKVCATYMTEKSMKEFNSSYGPAKRKARYEAFTSLLGEVANEIESMGGKMLTGPHNFQQTSQRKRNYWLERLDPHHRAGYLISDEYETWVASHSTDTFWVWLKAHGGKYIKAQSRVAGYENPEGAQWNHSYYIENGKFCKNIGDTPLCTRFWRTEFSEAGWGVFVCSMPMVAPDGTLGIFVFSYSHHAGWDHHSSFLGGAPVMAAGEWIVDNAGRLRVMTAKSGHYMPKWQNLHRFVTRFPEIPSDAIIRPNMLDHQNGADAIKYYRIGDFRLRKLAATPLKRAVVLDAIRATGANSTIYEHTSAGMVSLSSLLPT